MGRYDGACINMHGHIHARNMQDVAIQRPSRCTAAHVSPFGDRTGHRALLAPRDDHIERRGRGWFNIYLF
jgi:hypothetical protein